MSNKVVELNVRQDGSQLARAARELQGGSKGERENVCVWIRATQASERCQGGKRNDCREWCLSARGGPLTTGSSSTKFSGDGLRRSSR